MSYLHASKVERNEQPYSNSTVITLIIQLPCSNSRDHLLVTKAFCVFVRPLLEYCSVIWNARYTQRGLKLKCIQRHFTTRFL